MKLHVVKKHYQIFDCNGVFCYTGIIGVIKKTVRYASRYRHYRVISRQPLKRMEECHMNNEEEKTVYALQNPENVRKMYKALSIIGEHLDELKIGRAHV